MPTVAEAQRLHNSKGSLQHIIPTTSTAVQIILGQRAFLCFSATWVQHAAGLHAFTAKQQSSGGNENEIGDTAAVVLANLLESVTDWYPVSGEFCPHNSTQRQPQKKHRSERSCIFNRVEHLGGGLAHVLFCFATYIYIYIYMYTHTHTLHTRIHTHKAIYKYTYLHTYLIHWK